MRIAFSHNTRNIHNVTSLKKSSVLDISDCDSGNTADTEAIFKISADTESVILDPQHPKKTLKVGFALPMPQKQRVVELLQRYKEVFA